MPTPSGPAGSPSDADRRTPSPAGLEVYTPEEAALRLKVRESWLRRRAAARLIPCTFFGKHLRFTGADIAAIVSMAAQPPTGLKPRRAAPTHRSRGL